MIRLNRGAMTRKCSTIGLLFALLLSSSPALGQTGTSSSTGAADARSIAPAVPPAVPSSQAPPAESAFKFTSESPGKTSDATGQAATGEDKPGIAYTQPSGSSAGTQADLKSTAPPEVTEPQPLAIAPSSTGQPIATRLVDKRTVRLPVSTGAVQIRRPFKLFAREELIRNLSFRDTPVKEVIGELSRRGGLNIIVDGSVKGKITGDLKDITLNEAMDSVLAAAGLQSRTMDNNTVVVGSMQAMTQLGLNRPMARAFKLSYAHPYDVAMLLHSSVFNRGVAPEFATSFRRRSANRDRNENNTDSEGASESDLQATGEGGGRKGLRSRERKTSAIQASDDSEITNENNQTTRLEMNRQVRGISRSQTQEGVGFNNAATDPGSQQIRQFQETPADYTVEQNGGGAIVIPDVKNRQVIVVGTADDIAVAEEAIHLLDRRPRQVHIQASLIEISNQGIRQLGAQLNLQGAGLSGTILGPGAQPLIQSLRICQ